jgi:hypothetical protein
MLETHFANLPVTDLAVDDTHIELFHEALDKISKSSDPLKDNYRDLNPKDYISFPAVIREGKIACFSGIISTPDKWGQNIARMSTRLWVDYQYRFSGLVKFRGGPQFMNTTYCLPTQVQRAKDAGIKCLFISREGKSNIGLSEYLNLIKINNNLEFKLLPNKYNTCGSVDPIPESCKQFIAIHALTPDGEDVWNQNMNSKKITE